MSIVVSIVAGFLLGWGLMGVLKAFMKIDRPYPVSFDVVLMVVGVLLFLKS